MQNKFMKLGAKVTAAATMLAMFASVTPALADNATIMSDLMTRQALGATSDHTVTLTLPASFVDGDLNFTFENVGAGWTFPATATGTCAPSGGTIADNGSATNVLAVTTTGCAAGDVATITDAGVTNDDTTAGSRSIVITGTAATTGTFATALDDSDQVTVTATVSPSITFDLDANMANGNDNAPYTVDLGALTVGATNVSDHTTINSIYTDLATNATSGAVVTVLNANDNQGLKSLSSGDFIPSTTGTMAAGTANYGLCVASATAATGTYAAAGSYAAPTCVAGTDGNTVVTLSNVTPDPILNTAGAPLTTGRSEILVNAAISTSTTAHNDYQDILTFVATGTF